jgi:hypothetical protein
MRLIPLTSSSIAAIGWSEGPEPKAIGERNHVGDLVVQFQTRSDWSGYRYFDVPMEMFVDIVTADSQGRAFDALIKKGHFSWVKVTPDEVKAIQ